MKWVQEELLGGPSPFGGDFVPVPWDAPRVPPSSRGEERDARASEEGLLKKPRWKECQWLVLVGWIARIFRLCLG